MKKAELLTLVAFNTWANRRILAKAARLAPRALHGKANLSYPSPIATLVHVLDTQWYWREGIQVGILPSRPLIPADFPSLHALRRRWDEEDRLLLGYLSSRTQRQVDGNVTYTWRQARPRTRPLWHIITHVVNHGTQHRTELAVFLTAKKLSPRNMDFLDYIRHKTNART